MSRVRFNHPSSAHSDSTAMETTLPGSAASGSASTRIFGQEWDFWAVRFALIGTTVVLCYTLGPFGFHGLPAAGLGFFIAMVILLAELRLRHAEISGLVGGTVGAVLGLLAALLITLVISHTSEPEPNKSFFEFASLFALGYLGLVLGSRKAKDLQHTPLPRSVEVPAPIVSSLKLLDTSVLIDGRIADICETHFLDGALGLPRFVLHELQQVADSSDPLKRQRGRRGLEVLERMQKMPGLDICFSWSATTFFQWVTRTLGGANWLKVTTIVDVLDSELVSELDSELLHNRHLQQKEKGPPDRSDGPG